MRLYKNKIYTQSKAIFSGERSHTKGEHTCHISLLSSDTPVSFLAVWQNIHCSPPFPHIAPITSRFIRSYPPTFLPPTHLVFPALNTNRHFLGTSKSLPEKQVSYLQILLLPPIFQGSYVWASSQKQGGQQRRQVNFVTSFSLPFLQIQYRVSSPPVAALSSGTFFGSLASK